MLDKLLNKVKAGGLVLLVVQFVQLMGWENFLAPGWQEVLNWVVVMGTMYLVPESEGTKANLK